MPPDLDQSLALLREVVRTSRARNEFPSAQEVRERHKDEPWVMDELLENGWASGDGGWFIPTIEGLVAADTVEARQTLTELDKLVAVLRRSDPRKVRAAGELATTTGFSNDNVVGRLLAILAVGPYPFIAQSEAPHGRVGAVSITPAIDGWVVSPASSRPLQVQPGPPSYDAQDFRGLLRLRWCPGSGVSLLVGANGAGKSSSLEVLSLLRDIFESGPAAAVAKHHGTEGLRRDHRPGEVLLGVEVGTVRWELRLQATATGLQEFPAELVLANGKPIVRRAALSPSWYLHGQRLSGEDARSRLRAAWDRGEDAALKPLVDVVQGARTYGRYDLSRLQGSSAEDNSRLVETGENLFHVLRNWKSAEIRFEGRYEWVLRNLRDAFPDLVERLEFLEPRGGPAVPAYFYPPRASAGTPLARAADGLLVGLAHLVAVAGAPEGGVIAIDEFENHLHPHAIRTLLAAMRQRADEKRLTVILTSHSPVVMNEFRDATDHFYVIERGQDPGPVALESLHEREWLSLFSLGLLYEDNKFGAPKEPS